MLTTLLFTGVFPCLVVVLLLLGAFSFEPTSEARASRFAGACGAFAVGSAYLVGHPAVRGALPDGIPVDVTDWPWLLVPVAIVMGIVESFSGNYAVRWILRVALVGGVLCLVGGPALENSLLPGGWLQLFLMGLALIVYQGLLDGPYGSTPKTTDLAAMGVATGGSAFVILLGESASFGQMCSIVALALGVCWALSCANARLHPGRGLTPVLLLTHGLLLVSATLYASLPPLAALLLILTPLPVFLGRKGPIARLEGLGRPAAVLVGVLILVAGSAAVTHLAVSPA